MTQFNGEQLHCIYQILHCDKSSDCEAIPQYHNISEFVLFSVTHLSMILMNTNVLDSIVLYAYIYSIFHSIRHLPVAFDSLLFVVRLLVVQRRSVTNCANKSNRFESNYENFGCKIESDRIESSSQLHQISGNFKHNFT